MRNRTPKIARARDTCSSARVRRSFGRSRFTMTRRFATLLLLICDAAAEAAYDACSPHAPLAVSHAAVGTLDTDGTCPSGVDEEHCVCGAMRLGLTNATRTLLRARMLRREPAPAVRRLAQATHAGTVAILARLHPKYPHHLKIIPALEWAQNEQTLTVRVRFARYCRGEPLAQAAEQITLLWDDEALFLTAEGADAPAYFVASLKWAHRLKRHDGCGVSEPECAKWAAEGSCDDPPSDASAPPMAERCKRSCGGCPSANGTAAVDGTWAAVPGGVVFEATKAVAEAWERPLATRLPPNRIDHADGGLEVGGLLRCASTCRQAAGCQVGDGSGWSSWSLWSSQAKEMEPAQAADCVERCRRQCERELGPTYAVK